MTEAFAYESKKLEETLKKIGLLRDKAESEVTLDYDELTFARAADQEKIEVRELVYLSALSRLSRCVSALKRPYFTRVDFSESGENPSSFYIGKYGISDPDTLETVVTDWRAPISNLYYSGQLGHVSYEAPDGKIEGELTLKRQFEIKDGALLGVYDRDIASQDEYLNKALSSMSGERLKDIVSTIQSEQNLVIRQPLLNDLIVQGAAGSGKTTIALHRIAYLLYAYSDRLRAERMLILAPNPLFLDFISGVLPDLGVDKVEQTTYAGFLGNWLGLKAESLGTPLKADDAFAMTKDRFEYMRLTARSKGSSAFCEALKEFLKAYEKRLVPEESFKFGPVTLWTKAEAEDFMLRDEAPFPLATRLSQFKKQLKKRLQAACKDICAWFKAECDKRASALRASLDDGEELNSRLRLLYESRDRRVSETRQQSELYLKNCLKDFPSCEPRDIYKSFLAWLAASDETKELTLCARETLARAGASFRIFEDDLAPLALITLFAKESVKPVYRHLVIDEAQDMSPIELYALKALMPEATFTIVGDLMQGISAFRGISSWAEFTENILPRETKFVELSTSYRSTREIMHEAFKPARGLQDCSRIKLIRSGDECEYIQALSEKDRIEKISDLIARAFKIGCATVCVAERDTKRAKALCKTLPASCEAKLLESSGRHFEGGLYVASASDVKGLEFDEVIIADASKRLYGDNEFAARLLYVAMTRALHRLDIVWLGELTPLLKQI